MLASSFLDPVLGIDVHFEMVPTPAPVPTPIPNPFIGLVFDPIGLAAGIAIGAAIGAVVGAKFQGPVLYWTAFPATNTGTEAKHVPGHILIPPGVAWAPFPKTPKPVIHPGETPTPALPVKPENDAVVITGSKTVTVMGSNAVRLGDIALSCSEPLRLPSSVVLAVPKGAPILIGGPMSLDIMAALMASLRTRFVSDSLHALLSRLKPSRFRNLMHRVVCFFTGHPVDVASGKVMTEFVDITLPGPLPLKVERIYSSAFASRPGPVGHGWSLSLDQAVWRERGKVVLLAEDGREIELDTFDFPQHRIEPGQRVYDPIQRLTLCCEKGDAWRVIDHEGIVREFAPVAGREDGRAMIQRIRSRCGNHAIEFHYRAEGTVEGGRPPHAVGRLEWVRDSGGRLVHLRYDAHGRVTELHVPQPQGEGSYRHRRYEYDAAGDLVQVTDSLGHRWRFGYVTHLLTQETDRNGLSFYFAYDGLGEDAWCVRTWGDGGIYDHVLKYDKRRHVTFVTNSLGYATQYHMNLVGQVVKIVDPLGGETKYEYDPVTLQRTKEVNELGAITSYQYDQLGRMVSMHSVIDDEPLRRIYEGECHLPSREITPDQTVWSWKHDRSNLPSSMTAPDGAQTSWTIDRGLCTSVTTPAGRTTTFAYDQHFNVSSIVLPNGTRRDVDSDRFGRIIGWGASSGKPSRVVWDTEGRPLAFSSPSDGDWRLVLDPEGKPTLAEGAGRRVSIRYGATGVLLERVEADDVVSFLYDSELQLRGVINESCERHSFTWDAAGLLVAERAFDGRMWHYRRDLAGRLIHRELPSGESVDYAYDDADRIIHAKASDGRETTFEYASNGMVSRITNAAGTISYTYDSMGRVRRETFSSEDGLEQTDLRMSADGEIIEHRTSRGSRVAMSFSELGAPVSYHASSGGNSIQVELTYDDEGREIGRRLPGRASLTTIWGSGAHPLRTVAAANVGGTPTVVRDRHYRWAAPDRLLGMTDSRWGIIEYGYDSRGRLVHERHGEALFLRTLDATGNPFRRADRADRKYGAGGRLLASDAGSFEYDADGNRVTWWTTAGHRWQYHWSAEGQLVAAERSDGRKVHFEYDGLGRRRLKTVVSPVPEISQKKTRYFWCNHVVLHEIGDDEETAFAYESDSFAPLAAFEPDATLIVASDHTGAPALLFDIDGRPVGSYHHDLYGQARAEHGSRPITRRWPGQVEDPDLDGLYYNWHRYYDPRSGLYISPDPIGLLGGLVPYGYVGDPNVWIDPLGLGKQRTFGGPQARDLALGRYNHSGQPGGGGLTDFARQFDAAHANTMVSPANQLRRVNSGSFAEAFEQAVSSTIERGRTIRFDLTGVNVRDALAFRLTGDAFADMYPGSTTRVTEWELRQIMGNREWFENTVFYLNGRRLSKKDLRKMGIRCGG